MTYDPNNFAVYDWSGENDYFILCNSEQIAVGGGGTFGLILFADFEKGSTGCCRTFDNPPLMSPLAVPSGKDKYQSVHFAPACVELWDYTV